MQGASEHEPVAVKVVGWVRTAGFGEIEKFAVGGCVEAAGQPLAPTRVPAGVPGHWSELSGTPSPSVSAGGGGGGGVLAAWSA